MKNICDEIARRQLQSIFKNALQSDSTDINYHTIQKQNT